MVILGSGDCVMSGMVVLGSGWVVFIDVSGSRLGLVGRLGVTPWVRTLLFETLVWRRKTKSSKHGPLPFALGGCGWLGVSF